GNEAAMLPSVAARRIAFLSARQDDNLWTIDVDGITGVARGPLTRMTRGPGILGFLTTTKDSQTLAYSSVRQGDGEIYIRDLQTDVETTLSFGPPVAKWYPALSPSGEQLAFGTRVTGGERAIRPIFIARPYDATWETLSEDGAGRPRQWVDERL